MQHRSLAHLFAKFLWLGLAVSGVWSQLDDLGVLVWALCLIPLGVVLWTMRVDRKQMVVVEFPYRAHAKVLMHDRLGALLIGFVALPSLFAIVASWSGEFPFSGDHDHHVAAVLRGLEFWRSAVGPLLLGLFGIFAFSRLWPKWWWPLVGGLTLIGVSFFAQAPAFYFARYPASVYTLAAPLVWWAQAQEWSNLGNTLRLVNFLAIPIGLLVIRPLIATKPLGFGFLLFALFFFWQKDVIYYSTSSYLEPWCLLFVILAGELILADDERKWLPVLLVGLAAVFKEQAILLLPFFWVASYKKFWVNTSRLKESLAAGTFAGLPFVIYFLYRQHENIWRTAGAVGSEQVFSAARIEEWFYRLTIQFGATGLLLLTLVVLYALWSASTDRNGRIAKLCLLAGASFQILFFYMDGISQPWTGYPRFHLLAFALVGLFLIELGENLRRPGHRSLLLAMVLIGNGIPTAKTLALFANSDTERSFFEHYDSAQFFPLRQLVETAERDGVLFRGSTIALNSPSAQFHAQSLGLGYRDLIKKFHFVSKPDSQTQPICGCSSEANAVVLFRLPTSGLNNLGKLAGLDSERAASCVEGIRQTCRKIFEEKRTNGQWVGVLGVGTK